LGANGNSDVAAFDPPVTAQVSLNGNGHAPAPEELGGVDKIRELLFGAQIQNFDRRFSKLEERFLQRAREIESEMERNLSAFETNARKQVESLANQLLEEKELRADAEKEVREHTQSVEKRSRAISDQLARLERDLSERLSQETQSLREEIRRRNDDTKRAVETIFASMAGTTTDRNLLAGLFAEVARCLKQEPTARGGGAEMPRGWPAT
jgi:chromosome segregation ATPase